MPKSAPDGVLRDGYDTGGFYDEAFEHGSDGVPVARAHYAELIGQIASMDGSDLRRAAELANRSFLHRGVTFTVYSEGEQAPSGSCRSTRFPASFLPTSGRSWRRACASASWR